MALDCVNDQSGENMQLEATMTTPRPGGTITPAALELTGITRRFGRRWALRGVDLRLEAGEAVALLGHNGSGKTTLLRILSTAIRPTHGSGRIFGHDLVREAGQVRESIGVLGHTPGIYGDLTAAENLRFALRMLGRRPDEGEIGRALAAVGLARETDTRARYFSAGMQRRLSLARLMLRRARLVLLDEPYAAFDVDGIERMNAFLLTLKAQGCAVVVATHDLARALPVVDRAIRLAEGREVDATVEFAADVERAAQRSDRAGQ